MAEMTIDHVEAGAGVSAKVKAARKLVPNLTQAAPADRMHVSVSLVRAVEQGRAPASPSFVAAAAKALRVTVYDLYDQPTPRFGEERAHIAELETAIMAGFALATDHPHEPLETLAAQVTEIQRLQRRSKYDRSSLAMPDLLAQLHTAASQATGGEAEQAHRLLTMLYECALICLHRLGSPLAGQAAERAAAAADQSGDPLLAALTRVEVGLPLMHRGA